MSARLNLPLTERRIAPHLLRTTDGDLLEQIGRVRSGLKGREGSPYYPIVPLEGNVQG